MRNIRKNIWLFKLDAFAAIWPLSTLAIIYFQQITHSYALAMLVWSVSNLVQTFSEIPTGIYSDKIGRKKTLIIAALSSVLCFFLWALAGQLDQMWLLFVGAAFYGLGESFLSGANEALMYETVEEMNQKENFSLIYAKYKFWGQVGLIISALSAAILTYYCSLQTVAWISVLPVSGHLITALLFVEPKRTKRQKKTTSWVHFFTAFRQLWYNKKLRFYSAITIIDDAVGSAFLRIESAYYNTLIKAWLINIVRLVKQIAGLIGFAMMPFFKRFGSAKCFFSALVLSEVLRVAALLLNNVFSPFVMAFRKSLWGISHTAQTDILQREFSTDQRATMQSIIALLKGVLAAGTLYLFGVVADVYDPKMAIWMAVWVKVAVLFTSFFILRQEKTLA